jgi:hypothetical protein
MSLKFSGPETLEIPGVRDLVPMCLGTDTTGLLASGRPPNRGGLSVFETLHLVADIPKRYQMF